MVAPTSQLSEHNNEWRSNEFKTLMNLLMKEAPPLYKPHLLLLEKGGKHPIPYVSWKKKEKDEAFFEPSLLYIKRNRNREDSTYKRKQNAE